MTAARSAVSLARKPLQRRWLPEQTWTARDLLFARPSPSSCSGKGFSSSPLPPLPPPPPEREATAEEAQRQAIEAVQDLIRALQQTGRIRVLEELSKLVSDHYVRMGSLRPTSQQERQEKFHRDFRRVLEHRTSPGKMQDLLLEYADSCHLHFELLQDHLYDALSQDGDLDLEMGDDEGHVGNADLFRMLSQQQQPTRVGSEARPLAERRVMDVQVVSWRRAADTPVSAPTPETSILLANLPQLSTESDIHATLSTSCGEIEQVWMCEELENWSQDIRRLEAEDDGAPTVQRPYTMRYAFIQFKSEDARRRATRKLPRLNGILFKEVLLLKLRTAWKETVVARPSFPQDVRLKRSLLLRNLSAHLGPVEVLRWVSEKLSSGSGGSCRLRLLNCPAFDDGGAKLKLLEVEAEEGKVVGVSQIPSVRTLENCAAAVVPSTGGAAAVLRFQSFEDAFSAKDRLSDFSIQGRAVVCSFPPWRPVCTPADSRGLPLDQPILFDMPVPRASARYGPLRENDPVLVFGMPEEEFEVLTADACKG